MFLKVIFPDGTIGTVKFTALTNLIKSGKIIAFHCSEGWVEVRRKSKSPYVGVDRRRANPEMFLRDFNFDESVV